MPDDIYVPRDGARIPMPGNAGDWPADGRPINPLSPYERRLKQDGDLVLKPAATAASSKKGQGGDTGGDQS
ncbi:hypothetical protein [Rhizobium sp. BK602]|uniref:hypothetical protein n=1 Tax=Rhizobium sp. BK602 TaxID=2586986 RepID=UPI00160FBBBB|nr:hypothetical protein [Rhizobium sp. BK602]MBB3608667.1 hypothetical protein [Rhizobium sp. BK602]